MENKSTINKDELKAACSALGLNYNEFIEEPKTIEKGLGSGVDYENLYHQQLKVNQDLLMAISNSNNQITKNFEEVQKGLNEINSQFEKMGASPLHNRKSFDKIKVLEKSFSGEQQNSAKATFSISSQNKQLKNFLGDRMMEELQKGISNGIYERAAMQFDATGVLNNDLINQIYQKDKILITA